MFEGTKGNKREVALEAEYTQFKSRVQNERDDAKRAV